MRARASSEEVTGHANAINFDFFTSVSTQCSSQSMVICVVVLLAVVGVVEEGLRVQKRKEEENLDFNGRHWGQARMMIR